MFVDPVVLRMRPWSAGARVREVLGHVRDVFLTAVEHADVPYQDVVHNSGRGGDLRNPLFAVIVTMFDNVHGSAGVHAEATPLELPAPAHVKFDLSIEFVPRADGLLIHVLYPTDRYLTTTVQRFVERLAGLLTTIAERGTDIPVARPPSVGPATGQVRARFAERFGPPRSETAPAQPARPTASAPERCPR
jgi:hypothetical protein